MERVPRRCSLPWASAPNKRMDEEQIGGLVAKLCPTFCDPKDCSLPGFSVHGIFPARILEGVAISFSRGSSPPRDRTWVFCIASGFFTNWATREAIHIWRANGEEQNEVSKEKGRCFAEGPMKMLKNGELKESRKNLEVTVKNELLIAFELGNMGFPSSTEAPVELAWIRSAASWHTAFPRQVWRPRTEAAYDGDYPGWGLTKCNRRVGWEGLSGACKDVLERDSLFWGPLVAKPDNRALSRVHGCFPLAAISGRQACFEG